MNSNNHIHPDLAKARELVYDPCGFTCSQISISPECVEYGASFLQLDNLNIIFRVAKITPKKRGQFVTLWKRNKKSVIEPYDTLDPLDYIVVSTRDNSLLGQFVFPRSILLEKNIISINGEGGKLGIRVYPPWEKAINRQAKHTQEWKINYFLEIPEQGILDCERSRTLYS